MKLELWEWMRLSRERAEWEEKAAPGRAWRQVYTEGTRKEEEPEKEQLPCWTPRVGPVAKGRGSP